MNILTTDTGAARIIARQVIAERVRDAEKRRLVRAAREERHAIARAQSPQEPRSTLARWSVRFLHPAH